MSTDRSHSPKTRRTLSGKRLNANIAKRSWRDVIGLPATSKPAKGADDQDDKPTTVDVVMRRKSPAFTGQTTRRQRRAFTRAAPEDQRAVLEPVDQFYGDVDPFEVSGQARAARRRGERRRATEQRKGNRAFQRQQARIVRDNADVEHLILLAGGAVPDFPVHSEMAKRARKALEARAAEKKLANA